MPRQILKQAQESPEMANLFNVPIEVYVIKFNWQIIYYAAMGLFTTSLRSYFMAVAPYVMRPNSFQWALSMSSNCVLKADPTFLYLNP